MKFVPGQAKENLIGDSAWVLDRPGWCVVGQVDGGVPVSYLVPICHGQEGQEQEGIFYDEASAIEWARGFADFLRDTGMRGRLVVIKTTIAQEFLIRPLNEHGSDIT